MDQRRGLAGRPLRPVPRRLHRPPRRPRPHPPLWIGGWGPAAVRRTVQFGDAWHPNQLDIERVQATLPALREEADRQGRPVPAFCPGCAPSSPTATCWRPGARSAAAASNRSAATWPR
ncbi:LLM class flavin-dependent oxidoreductase [Phytohabitans houttuyneae]|uniref:LLM class flavin-dependent oxidoreductase n=1 Tax=Phytohabitans houttuyneae TaxID=1076126 RepID=UPI00353078C8